jgi:polyphosphate kinase 2
MAKSVPDFMDETKNSDIFNSKGMLKKDVFEKELRLLQVELVKLQNWVKEKNKRILIIFEGRDTAGKGGTIKRLTEHLNPRGARIVALGKPSDIERGQWYFQRYIPHLPNPGEIVLFDRSWYNRAGVERVMNFCTKEDYQRFMKQVPNFEQMLVEDGIIMFKYYLSITKDEQKARLEERQQDPLKRWKLSPVDMESVKYFEDYTKAKEEMFSRTHSPYSPWIIVKSNDKRRARLNIIRDILAHIEYDGKENAGISFATGPDIIALYSHLSFK